MMALGRWICIGTGEGGWVRQAVARPKYRGWTERP